MYHSIGTLLPNDEGHPQFSQIYTCIYDTDNELQNRMNVMPNLDPNILIELQQMLIHMLKYSISIVLHLIFKILNLQTRGNARAYWLVYIKMFVV